MFRPKKLIVVAVLAATMLVGATTTAHAEPKPEAPKPLAGVKVTSDFNLFNDQVHQQAYLTYLVKEYAPETLVDWEKAFAERKELGGYVMSGVGNGLIALSATPLQTPDAVDTSSQGIVIAQASPASPFTVTIRQGSITSDGDKLAIHSTAPQAMMLPHPVITKERNELKQQFAEAVAQQDAAAIKTILAELLVEYQDQNQLLRQIQNLDGDK